MSAVYKKELKSYFGNFLGYLFVSMMLVFFGFFTYYFNIYYSIVNFEYVYSSETFFYLLAIPVLTMRIFSEERHQRTDQLLYSLPLKMSSIVAGKYFAALTVLGIPCAVTGLYPLFFAKFGELNYRVIYATLLCFFLLGAALIAVCMFISSLTENQIVSAIISFIAVFVIYFSANLTQIITYSTTVAMVVLLLFIAVFCVVAALLTKNKMLTVILAVVLTAALMAIRIIKSEWIDSFASAFLEKFALFSAFDNTVGGTFEIGSVVLFISVAFLFNLFSIQALEKRRWA